MIDASNKAGNRKADDRPVLFVVPAEAALLAGPRI